MTCGVAATTAKAGAKDIQRGPRPGARDDLDGRLEHDGNGCMIGAGRPFGPAAAVPHQPGAIGFGDRRETHRAIPSPDRRPHLRLVRRLLSLWAVLPGSIAS